MDIWEPISFTILSELLGHIGVGFKGKDLSAGPDYPRGKKAKESQIRSQIVENHTWLHALPYDFLQRRLDPTLIVVACRSRP